MAVKKEKMDRITALVVNDGSFMPPEDEMVK